jgi:replication-associated recombination protein RarA
MEVKTNAVTTAKDTFMQMPTVGGYDVHQVLSALQKSIRRGLEEDALYWAVELYKSNHASLAWARFEIIATEDIGPADFNAVVRIQTLHELWTKMKKNNNPGDRLFFIQAVILLVREPKSRIVDNANIVFFEGSQEKKPIPDYALDIHTKEGRVMGRGNAHFFSEGTKLENSKLPDAYEERAKQIRK